MLFLLFIASCSGFSCFSFLLFLFCFSPLFLCLSLRPCDFSCFCCFSCLLSSCGVLFACFTIAFAFYGLCCLFCSSFSSLEFVLLYSCCSGFLSSFLYFSYSCCLFSALLVHCFTLRDVPSASCGQNSCILYSRELSIMMHLSHECSPCSRSFVLPCGPVGGIFCTQALD